jgi:hypothetical protein
MKLLVGSLLMAWGLVLVSPGLACEKHLDGHRNGSDTNAEQQQGGEAQRR